MNTTADALCLLFVSSAVMGVVLSPAGQIAIASSLVFRAGWAAVLAGSAAVDCYKAGQQKAAA